MQKTEIIDYLQWSALKVPSFLSTSWLEEGCSFAFYRLVRKYMCGTRVLSGNANTEKYLMQMGGETCAQYNMSHTTGNASFALAQGGVFSRVDFAVTVNQAAPLIQFREALADGEVVSKRFEEDEPKVIGDVQGNAQTIYLGDLKKRGKKGVFRAYDKGLEMGLDTPMTRFELEVRGKTAHTAMKRFLVGVPISVLIRAVVDIPDAPWWNEIMLAQSEPLPRFKQPEKMDITARRWHWLVTQVAPALGKLLAIEDIEGTQNYDRFMRYTLSAKLDAQESQVDNRQIGINDT